MAINVSPFYEKTDFEIFEYFGSPSKVLSDVYIVLLVFTSNVTLSYGASHNFRKEVFCPLQIL